MTPEDEIAALKAESARLREQVEALGALVHELQARLAQDSHNSSGSKIHITRRTTQWVGILRAFRIYIDGQYVGTVRDGATAEFPVEPGLHEVFLRVDWCGSPPVRVQCTPGGVARLICSGRANPFAALYAGFFDWDQFIHLFAALNPS